jgi:hypothetical protein
MLVGAACGLSAHVPLMVCNRKPTEVPTEKPNSSIPTVVPTREWYASTRRELASYFFCYKK